MQARSILVRSPFATFALLMFFLCGVVSAGRIWWDGSRDDAEAPPGKLLSDNDGYWGECLLTGVQYYYETPPDSPQDIYRDDKTRFGRRLLDGFPPGNWHTSVGKSPGQPLVVVFDFKRQCLFSEVDICARSARTAVRIECRAGQDDAWQEIVNRSREDCPDRRFHRFPFPEPERGRFLRLSVQAEGTTWLDEVLVWGDADTADAEPEAYNPLAPAPVLTGVSAVSIPGIDKTAFSDAHFWQWQGSIGRAAEQQAVWSKAPTWDAITDAPLLPRPDRIITRLEMTLARNETDHAALVLTNTAWEKPRRLEVGVGDFRASAGSAGGQSRLSAKLYVGGAIPSRGYGVNIGPLLSPDNMPGRSLLCRYLANGPYVADFPTVNLSPAGSAVFWLSVTAHDAEPGCYEAEISCDGCAPLTVRARVLDVILPQPFVWLQTWSGTTSMFPFRYSDRAEREVRYKQSLGVTVWNGFPEPGTESDLARKYGRAIHHVYALPDRYIHGGYAGRIKAADLSETDEQAITDHVRSVVARASAMELGYDDWFGELWDEPGKGNSPLYGVLARMIRKADPKVRIYCNPSFWVDQGVMGDDDVFDALGSWYAEYVDVSVPFVGLLRDHPRCWPLFDSPRFVRAFYTVASQSAKSERGPEMQIYRRFAWDAFARGWNGWGFYSYYAPRGNPWNDFDADWYTGEDLPDYILVYPGPRGPIPTRQSEIIRRGWQDYCILTLMRERGMREELEALLKDYAAGQDMDVLRLRALQSLNGR